MISARRVSILAGTESGLEVRRAMEHKKEDGALVVNGVQVKSIGAGCFLPLRVTLATVDGLYTSILWYVKYSRS